MNMGPLAGATGATGAIGAIGRSPTTLVTVSIEGDFEQTGFYVAIEVGPDGARPIAGFNAQLPTAPAIAHHLNQWRGQHRLIGNNARIKAKGIVYEGSFQKQLHECQQTAQTLSQAFTQWLKTSSFLTLEGQLRTYLSPQDPIRICIRSANRSVQRLPWHLWKVLDQYPRAEIALSSSAFTPLPSFPSNSSTHPIRVLAIIGHSDGLDVNKDQLELAKLPNAEIQLLEAPTRQAFGKALRSQPWDILFFAGHSQTEKEKGYIALNANDNLSICDLKNAVRQAIKQGLQLAIFNSCDGLGLAWDLEELGLPQLVVMREPVPDAIAQRFLKAFLQEFAKGDSLYQAMRLARGTLQDLEKEFPCASWLPILYQHPSAIPPTWQELQSPPKPSNRWITWVIINWMDGEQSQRQHRKISNPDAADTPDDGAVIHPERPTIPTLATHGGYLVKTEGLKQYVVFEDEAQAVAWAVALQLSIQPTDHSPPEKGIDSAPNGCNIGIHTTKVALPHALSANMDFLAKEGGEAAALARLAQKRQILLSEVTAALLRYTTPKVLALYAHGRYPVDQLGLTPIWEVLYVGKQPEPPPRKNQQPQWAIALSASLIATLAIAGIRLLGWLQPLELSAYDYLMRSRPSEAMDHRLLIVEATEADVNQYGFPLPDEVLAEIIDTLNQHQPRVIGMDIFRNRPVPPGHETLLPKLQHQSNLISLCSIGQADNPNFPGIKPPPGVPNNRHGFSDVWPDPDGILRRQVLFADFDYQEKCATPFSFGALMALTYLEQEDIHAENESHNRVLIGSVPFVRLSPYAGGYQRLDNRGTQMLLNYRQANPLATLVSVSQLLEGTVEAELITNRIVVVGVTARVSNASDYFWTPLSAQQWPYQKISGVMIHAHMISQIVSAVLDGRRLIQPLPAWLDVLWIGGWSLISSGALVGLCCKRFASINQTEMAVGVGIVVIGLCYGSCWLLLCWGWWTPLIPTAIASVSSIGLISLYHQKN